VTAPTPTTVPSHTPTEIATAPQPTRTATPIYIPAITEDTASTVLFTHQPDLEDQDIRTAFLSGDGQSLVIVYWESTFERWDWNASTHDTYTIDAPVSEFLLQTRDDSLLFVGYNLNTEADIWLLTYQSGQAAPADAKVLSFPDRWVNTAAVSEDGRMLAVGYNLGRIHLIDTLTGDVIAEIEAFDDWVTFLKFSPNGNLLLADSFSFDPHTYVVDTESGSIIATLTSEDYDLGEGFFSPDSRMIGWNTFEGCQVFQAPTWDPAAHSLPSGYGFSWDNTQLFSAAENNTTRIFRLTDGSLITSLPFTRLQYLPDGRLVALEHNIAENRIDLIQLLP
jgi:WD40 repeat protein